MSYCKAKLGGCCHPSCTCGIEYRAPYRPRMNGKREPAMTPEQEQLLRDLIAEYGETLVAQARELSGLSMCMVALGNDQLTPAERERAYKQASMHLGRLIETMMSPATSAKVTECAKRIDAALDLWMADEIEKREGLPPA